MDFEAYHRARRSLGLVFQNPDDQLVTSIVEEDVAFGPENLGVPSNEIGERVRRELHRVAMEGYAKADPTRLSGGQKQRVAIAGALAMEPQSSPPRRDRPPQPAVTATAAPPSCSTPSYSSWARGRSDGVSHRG